MLINEPLQHPIERSIVVFAVNRRHAPHSVERVPIGIVHLSLTEDRSACTTCLLDGGRMHMNVLKVPDLTDVGIGHDDVREQLQVHEPSRKPLRQLPLDVASAPEHQALV